MFSASSEYRAERRENRHGDRGDRNRTIMTRFIGSIVPANSSSQVQLMCIYCRYCPPSSFNRLSICGWCRLARARAKGGGPPPLLFPSIRRIVGYRLSLDCHLVSVFFPSLSPLFSPDSRGSVYRYLGIFFPSRDISHDLTNWTVSIGEYFVKNDRNQSRSSCEPTS